MVGIVLLLAGLIAHQFMDTHVLSYVLMVGGAAMLYIQFVPHGVNRITHPIEYTAINPVTRIRDK